MTVNAPQCANPWTDIVSALYQSSVAIRDRESAMLRQVSQPKPAYEFHQHQFIAKVNSITQDEIDHICEEHPTISLSTTENLLFQTSDELKKPQQSMIIQ